MNDEDQIKEQGGDKLAELRQRVAKLEALETERKQEEQGDTEARLRRRLRGALFLSVFPLILFLCLISINTKYIGTMIFSCKSRGIPDPACSQPYGWIMAVVFIILLSASYFVTQKTSLLLKGNWWVNILLIFLFLILPAILIVLMCPAFLILIETSYK